MLNFDNTEELQKIDPQNTIGSVDLLAEQCETAWNESNKITVPVIYREIKNIVFCGMGASIYGALVMKALAGREMPFPSEIISDYFLPDYIDNNTLVVLTSYSGTTEEVLSCAKEAKARNAKMIVLTKGGELAQFAKDNTLPAYIFDGKLNSTGAPRFGCGYSILGLIGLLNKIGIFEIGEHKISDAISRLKEKMKDLKIQAQQNSLLLFNKIPIILTAEHLSGNAQILRNQFNETGKTFSSFFLLPDLNHHLMEGLQFPKNTPLHFITLSSRNFSEKIEKRIELTIDVIKQNNHEVYEFKTGGQTLYDDFLEVLVYGSYLTVFLGLSYNQNPATNPWVDYFKNKLAEN
ncbi:SIS domain-containing protein [Patescibacteria group bacterium]|nr:SIS domain-containing protein [Patescibacteria group bacterium]MBU4098048.1 SIS domain-containing protein [Patescibacteria group bacterium]